MPPSDSEDDPDLNDVFDEVPSSDADEVNEEELFGDNAEDGTEHGDVSKRQDSLELRFNSIHRTQVLRKMTTMLMEMEMLITMETVMPMTTKTRMKRCKMSLLRNAKWFRYRLRCIHLLLGHHRQSKQVRLNTFNRTHYQKV